MNPSCNRIRTLTKTKDDASPSKANLWLEIKSLPPPPKKPRWLHFPHPTLSSSVTSQTSEWIRSLIGRLPRGIVLQRDVTSPYKTSLSVAVNKGWGQTETEPNRTADHSACFQPTLTWRHLTGGEGRWGWDGERLWENWQGLGPICFTFWLLLPACLQESVCVQMDISVSHSSSPNWHLTAAPHGLLAGCVSARFSQRRKQQRRIKHHPAERALSPAPSTPFTPNRPPFLHSPSLSLAAISSGKQFAPQTAPSAHYRSSQSACRSEIHPSFPLSTPLPTSTSVFSPWLFPYGGEAWRRRQDIEDVLHPGSEPRETPHTADIWPRFQNLIFI